MDRLSVPDPRPFLATRALARGVEFHDIIDSTNLCAMALARAGCATGLAVIAGSQTAGRGRLGRVWDSPVGAGIYLSLVIRPRLSIKDAPLITLAVGVALERAIRGSSGADVSLKWPNDVLVSSTRRKLAGVLVETSGAIEHVVVGIGVNVAAVARPAEIATSASSIEEASGRRIDRAELIAAIALALEEELDEWASTGTEALLGRWSARAAGRGETVTIGDVEGVLEGVGPDGALRVRAADGIRTVYAGDLRLAGAPELHRFR